MSNYNNNSTTPDHLLTPTSGTGIDGAEATTSSIGMGEGMETTGIEYRPDFSSGDDFFNSASAWAGGGDGVEDHSGCSAHRGFSQASSSASLSAPSVCALKPVVIDAEVIQAYLDIIGEKVVVSVLDTDQFIQLVYSLAQFAKA
eukprot:GSA25T00012774001.1